jgi:CRISPR-associated endonuclease/helicase Cas3
LAQVEREREEPALPVLRHKDLLELFDTEPDLAGRDIDISRFVRATNDRDVQVAWRALGDSGPAIDAPDLHRDELCSVPVYELEKLTKEHAVWRYDGLRSRWVKVDHLFPGLAVVVDVAVGGYDAEQGFTQKKADSPSPVATDALPTEADTEDPLSFYAAEYVSLQTHAEDAAEAMKGLLAGCGEAVPRALDASELVAAARWHDAGKVHPVFQAMLVNGLAADDPRRSGGPWAKSDGSVRGRSARRYFRHELASALSWIAEGRSALGAYVIAAHHGKVRMSLRARPGEEPPAGPPRRFANGIYDGDELPEADLGDGVVVPAQALSLACMEMGDEGAWADLTQGLLEKHGPFQLAYLEMLVRVADWRASAKRQKQEKPLFSRGPR